MGRCFRRPTYAVDNIRIELARGGSNALAGGASSINIPLTDTWAEVFAEGIGPAVARARAGPITLGNYGIIDVEFQWLHQHVDGNSFNFNILAQPHLSDINTLDDLILRRNNAGGDVIPIYPGFDTLETR